MAELFDILGRAAMRLSAAIEQVITNSDYEQVEGFDIVTVERGNVQADHLNNQIIVNQDGLFDVSIGIDAEFSQSSELNIAVYVNDQPYSNNPASIQGRGSSKPVSLAWNSLTDLAAGDVIEVRAQSADSDNLAVLFRRLYFSVTADS